MQIIMSVIKLYAEKETLKINIQKRFINKILGQFYTNFQNCYTLYIFNFVLDILEKVVTMLTSKFERLHI